MKALTHRQGESVLEVPCGHLVVERFFHAIDPCVAGVDIGIVRDETSAVVGVVNRMDDAGDGHENLLGIAIRLFQLLGEA